MKTDKTIERELLSAQRLLEGQESVFNDELLILRGRIRNYLQKHRTDVLWDIFRSIFQLGREYERYQMYYSSATSVLDKATMRERMSETKREQFKNKT